VTIGSDDPPLFNTTLTGEYLAISAAFGYDAHDIEAFVLNAVNASLLEEDEKAALADEFRAAFEVGV
jgi:adenosine deaminase